MDYNFFMVGGDMRNYILAEKLLKDGNNVKVLGFEKIEEKNNNLIAENYIKDDDIIISAIPFTKDGENIYSPYSDKNIKIDFLKGKKVIAGKITNEISNKYNIDKIDIMENEAITVLNTIPTAEGAIQLAMEKTNYTLDGANIMVLGFGNVGKTLCYKLKNMGANVFAEARKDSDLAWIKVYGYNQIGIDQIKQNMCKMDIIFNTIPSLILDKNTLILAKNKALIIDLASNPGGIDFESAKKLGIEAILYGGIPGKVAPNFCAEQIKQFVYKTIKRENNINN